MLIPFTDPQCPWTSFALGPMITCEQRLCSWVRQPSNSWSNLIFLVLVVAFFQDARRSGNRVVRDFAGIGAFLGLFSFFAHASQTYLFSTLDYLMQFAVIGYILALNLLRAGVVKLPFPLLYTGIFLVATAAQLFFTRPGMMIFTLMTGAAVLSEMYLMGTRPKTSRRGFFEAALLLLAGTICFALDAKKTVCFPENHFFQLHSWWHVLTAAALFYLVKYYRQFEKLRR